MRMLFKTLNVFKEKEYFFLKRKEGQKKRKSGKEHQKIQKPLKLKFLIPT